MEKKQKRHLQQHMSTYRYEFLLVALLFLLFDKMFVNSYEVYLKYVWPFNMLLITIACFGIFHDNSRRVNIVKNILSAISLLMPFGFLKYGDQSWFLHILSTFFIVYYAFIFFEVMRQITKAQEVGINVIIGSFCGYLLLILVALFSYMYIELHYPGSFHGITQGDIPKIYIELSYFSFITFTSIGFGDIYPLIDISRLATAFFGMVGQFYMVAIVGIIISKFSSK